MRSSSKCFIKAHDCSGPGIHKCGAGQAQPVGRRSGHDPGIERAVSTAGAAGQTGWIWKREIIEVHGAGVAG